MADKKSFRVRYVDGHDDYDKRKAYVVEHIGTGVFWMWLEVDFERRGLGYRKPVAYKFAKVECKRLNREHDNG